MSKPAKPLASPPSMPTLLPYLVCFLGASFYLYEFILQVSTAVITHELMRDLQVDAAGLGIVSAVFYLAYTPMQIPAGLLYDRYGPRLLLSLAVAVCAIGALTFTATHSVWMACLGRFFMGAGAAYSFIGALVLISRWFPPHKFALMSGLVQLLSAIGAILAGMPLATVIDGLGWRTTLFTLGIIGLALALAIAAIVRDHPPGSQRYVPAEARDDDPELHWTDTLQHELSRLWKVCRFPQTWYIGLYAFLIWTPILAFAGLWGVPYLKAVYQFNDAKASLMVAFLWMGMGICGPLIGLVSGWLNSRCVPLCAAALLGLVACLGALYLPHPPQWFMALCLFCIGCAASGQSLSFAVVNDLHKRSFVGTAIGFNNMATVAGGLLFQPLIGLILTWVWHPTRIGTVAVYDAGDYRIAMSILPLCYALCWILARYGIYETHTRPRPGLAKAP